MDGHLLGLLISDGSLSVINNNLLINFGIQRGNNNVKTQFPCAYTSFVIVMGATFQEGYVGFNPTTLTTFNKGAVNGWPCQWISIGY